MRKVTRPKSLRKCWGDGKERMLQSVFVHTICAPNKIGYSAITVAD